MSNSSSDKSRYDYSQLLKSIEEALDISTLPQLNQAAVLPLESSITKDNQQERRRNDSKINNWNDDMSLIMDDKDKLFMEEQFRIMEQIELRRTTDKIAQNLSKQQSQYEDSTLLSFPPRTVSHPGPKLQEMEGTVVKLLNDFDRSVSSLGASDSQFEDISSSNSNDSYCDYSKLIQNIKEAVGASSPAVLQERSIDKGHPNYHYDDLFLVMNDKDELLIEEQFRILHQIHEETNIARKTQDPSK